jgi:hypothetical protein
MPGFIDRKEAERDAAIRTAADATFKAEEIRRQREATAARQVTLRRETEAETGRQNEQLRQEAQRLYDESPFPSLLERLQQVSKEPILIDLRDKLHGHHRELIGNPRYSHTADSSFPEYSNQPDIPNSSHLVVAHWQTVRLSDLPIIQQIALKVEYSGPSHLHPLTQKTWAVLGFYLESRADGTLMGHGRETLSTSFETVRQKGSDFAQDFLGKLYSHPRVLQTGGEPRIRSGGGGNYNTDYPLTPTQRS